jgi:RNA ligase
LDFSKEHWVDTKLDGSMIAVFAHEGKLVWGTKMVAPDFHDMVEKFVESSDIDYAGFCWQLINDGYTPIFEWMHPQKRIVIDYGKEPALTLLAVRNMITGVFADISDIDPDYGVPIVEQHSKVTDPKAFMEYVHDLKNAEGFVIRWADGHRVKIKAHEYLQIHKAKEAILQDRNIVSLIVENLLDDIKSHLPSEDKIAIEEFENKINAAIIRRMDVILQIFDGIGNSDRKSFALGLANELDQFTKAAIFTCWDKRDANSVLSCIKNTILNNLSKTVKYEYIKSEWFPLVQYNSI